MFFGNATTMTYIGTAITANNVSKIATHKATINVAIMTERGAARFE
jgi:hypothetical protein